MEAKCLQNGLQLIIGNSYPFSGEFWEYVGDFDSIKDAPKRRCCYTVDNKMFVRRVLINENSPKERRKRTDDSRPIDTTVKDEDNTLMVLVKQALKYRGITRGEFRKLFDNTSDMNNMLRCIECGDKLSWPRFTDMIFRLNLKYDLAVYSETENGEKEDIATKEE
jgi:hypothetical protein